MSTALLVSRELAPRKAPGRRPCPPGADTRWRATMSSGASKRHNSSMAFVGRGRALARLRAAIEESATGHSRLVLVSGVAGIGKTALISAVTGGSDVVVGWAPARTLSGRRRFGPGPPRCAVRWPARERP